jgi:pyrroloquinoline quinone biosynthesis protein E
MNILLAQAVEPRALALPSPPLAVLMELTHRCPLACPYCSNPLELASQRDELDTAGWLRVIDQSAAMGVLQLHFSGGEPALRKDLVELLQRARERGLYSNLITSGIGIDEARLDRMIAAGLDHVQLSLQDATKTSADQIAGYKGSLEQKLRLAGWMRARELPLTLNAVVHRHNAGNVPRMIELALELGASRLEVAHTQYYGWGLINRAALMPSREQLDAATAVVEEARVRLRGELVIDYVTSDYYARRPQGVHGWLGAKIPQHKPARRRAAVPCRRNDSRHAFRQCARSLAARYLATRRSVRTLSRHGVDA